VLKTIKLYVHKSINNCYIGLRVYFQRVNLFKRYCAIIGRNRRRKKKETYEEKVDEFGNVIEKRKMKRKKRKRRRK
jgi:hypothetical protein